MGIAKRKLLLLLKFTSTQLGPLAALFARLTFGGLWSQNCVKEAHLMGGHVFLEYMSFRMTCFMSAYVLREVMYCRRKCLAVCDILLEYMFYRRAYLTG